MDDLVYIFGTIVPVLMPLPSKADESRNSFDCSVYQYNHLAFAILGAYVLSLLRLFFLVALLTNRLAEVLRTVDLLARPAKVLHEIFDFSQPQYVGVELARGIDHQSRRVFHPGLVRNDLVFDSECCFLKHLASSLADAELWHSTVSPK